SLIAREIYEPGASILETIVKQDPNNQRFRMELGNTYVKLEKYQEAEKHFKHILSLNAEDPRSHYLLGLCYENWGKPDMALKEYREAVALNPDHFLAHFHRGLIHIESGRWDSAERAFSEARRLKPRNPTVLNNLGYIAIKGRKDFEEGIGMILEALENAPENPTVLGSLGSAYATAGDYEKAAKYLNASLALVPDDRRFIKVLKEVYGATGEQKKLSQLEEREKLIEK
ncbi:MAG: tetratricopeptide repeat protein, partial [Desulfobacterales bacterium]